MTVTPDGLSNLAALIVGFGVAVFVMRITREIEMGERGERQWVPWADRLLIGAVVASLSAVVILLVREGSGTRLGTALILGPVVCLIGYPFALLAHYRLLPPERWKSDKSLRDNPDGWEGPIVIVTVVAALGLTLYYLAAG